MAVAADAHYSHEAEADFVNLAEIPLPDKRPFLVSGWRAVVGTRSAGGVDRLGRLNQGGATRMVNVIAIFQRTAAVIDLDGDPLNIRQVELWQVWIDRRQGIWKAQRELKAERRRAVELELRLQEFQAELGGGNRRR